jgi:hypothetical protein
MHIEYISMVDTIIALAIIAAGLAFFVWFSRKK